MSVIELFTRFDASDRIRLVTAEVAVADGCATVEHVVSLRYGWAGPVPDHSCLPAQCAKCAAEFVRLALRRVGSSLASVVKVTVLRDRQASQRKETGRARWADVAARMGAASA